MCIYISFMGYHGMKRGIFRIENRRIFGCKLFKSHTGPWLFLNGHAIKWACQQNRGWTVQNGFVCRWNSTSDQCCDPLFRKNPPTHLDFQNGKFQYRFRRGIAFSFPMWQWKDPHVPICSIHFNRDFTNFGDECRRWDAGPCTVTEVNRFGLAFLLLLWTTHRKEFAKQTVISQHTYLCR